MNLLPYLFIPFFIFPVSTTTLNQTKLPPQPEFKQATTSDIRLVVKTLHSSTTLTTLINKYAEIYQVSTSTIHKVINCESGYNPRALGDNDQSRGLVQINRPSHPDISDAEAFDPEFSISFLAEKLSSDQGYLWTCHRQLYGDT